MVFDVRELRVHVTELFSDTGGPSLYGWNVDMYTYRNGQWVWVGDCSYDPQSGNVNARKPQYSTPELRSELHDLILAGVWEQEPEELKIEEPDDRCPCCGQLRGH